MLSRFITPFAWLASFFILLFLYTRLFGPVPFLVTSVTTQKSTTFDVTGEGKVTAKPDIAFVTAGISAEGQTVKSVQDQMSNVINKVSTNLKQLGVDSKDIQTTNYNIQPKIDFREGQRITGFTTNTNLQIKVRQLDKAGEVIDTATSSGANQISGVSFDIDDKTKLEDEARKKAVEEAKKKAQRSGQIAGFKLGRIINYSENQAGFLRPVSLSMEAAKAAGDTATQVEPGSSEVTINVTLSYEIL
ncbi:SIMPL domain-containing protein [Candidatus Daviesbacteria bacterium]|nr:SIMPL domain-containing protein [Candidatus Daviesbacteria bacterium]